MAKPLDSRYDLITPTTSDQKEAAGNSLLNKGPLLRATGEHRVASPLSLHR